MGAADYRRERGRLLAALAWNGWAHRKGYSETAGAARQVQLLELLELRRRRPRAPVVELPVAGGVPAAA